MYSLLIRPLLLIIFCVLSVGGATGAQIMSLLSPGANTTTPPPANGQSEIPATYLDLKLVNVSIRSGIEGQYGVISRWDLQAPGKAQREYRKGYQLLQKNDFNGALQHMSAALVTYPNYVSAHNGLGAALLALNRNDQAHAEFVRAVRLDDHVPLSVFNLGCSEMALHNYPAAEEAMQKAANLAPLDLYMRSALVLGQYLNRHFDAAIETAHAIYRRKHEGTSVVHLFAAAAWEAQHNFQQAEQELRSLAEEDPKSPVMSQVQEMMMRIKSEIRRSSIVHAIQPAPASRNLIEDEENFAGSRVADAKTAAAPAKISEKQDQDQNARPAEFSSDASTPGCPDAHAGSKLPAFSGRNEFTTQNGDPLFHASADEVEVFFSALEHGKAVTNLSSADLSIRDDDRPPARITSLRNESQLPLRIGFVIDTSDSITYRIKFEQNVALDFLRHVANGPDDLSFVTGFSNTVLLDQDFTNDRNRISQAIGQLAPSGGTALWDAVDFAAGKLAEHPECRPVARILVVFSDGQENSSSRSEQEAINRAQQEQVTVYTVSTREDTDRSFNSLAGERTLRSLAELTGGAALGAGSLHTRNAGQQLQQVIRNRYFVTYKPGLFKRDGRYHPIEIAAQRGGHKLRVYARKGYFAVSTTEASNF